MPNYCQNSLKVYGTREELGNFMTDVHGEGKSAFSFDKIIDMQEITAEMTTEPLPGFCIYRKIDWGSRHDEINVQISDEGNYLFYSFLTVYIPPLGIYDIIVERYRGLMFEISILSESSLSRYQIQAMEGDYTKYIEFYWEEVPWRHNSTKTMLYREDLIKQTLQVVEEEIFPRDH